MARQWSVILGCAVSVASRLVAVAAQALPPSKIQAFHVFNRFLGEGVAVARVGDHPITVDEVLEEVAAQGDVVRNRLTKPDRLRRFVEDRARFELLSRAAFARGLHRDPEVIDAARQVMVRKLLQGDMRELARKEIDDARVKDYFEKHIADYRKPEMRRFTHIQLKPTQEGQALAQKLLVTLREIEKQGDSQKLASEFSKLAARYSRGELPRSKAVEIFQGQEDVEAKFGPNFGNRVFSMASEEMAQGPVQSTKGWHVLRLLSVREPLDRPLEEVRAEIRDYLLQEKRKVLFDRYVGELQSTHPVAFYNDGLEIALERLQSGPNPSKTGSP